MKSGERALSVTEMLVAIAVLTAVALGIAWLLARSMAISSSAFDDARLVSAAQQALEELLSLPFTHPLLEPGPLRPLPPSPAAGSPAAGSPAASITISYQVTGYVIGRWQDVADPATWPRAEGERRGNLLRITVTASPLAGGGLARLQPLTLSALRVQR